MNLSNSTQTSNVKLTETELVVCPGFTVHTCIPCEAKTQMSSFFLLPNTWVASPAHRTGTCSSSVQQKPQGGQHDFYGFSLNIWSGHQMQCPKSHRDTLSGRCTTKRKLPVIKMHLWSQLTCMWLKLTIISHCLAHD